MSAVRVVGLAVAVAMALAACGGDDDDAGDTAPAASAAPTDSDTGGGGGGGGADEEAYVDAFAEGFQQGGADDIVISADQAECIAPRFVDVLGVERLRDAGVEPADVASGADLDFSVLDLDEDEGNDLYDSFGACDLGLRDSLVGALAADDEMDDDVRSCLEDELSEDVVRKFFVAGLVQGDEAAESDPEVEASLQDIFARCLGSVTGSVPTATDD